MGRAASPGEAPRGHTRHCCCTARGRHGRGAPPSTAGSTATPGRLRAATAALARRATPSRTCSSARSQGDRVLHRVQHGTTASTGTAVTAATRTAAARTTTCP
eukprot:159761-Alexandrium_andersonii.AAC.1